MLLNYNKKNEVAQMQFKQKLAQVAVRHEQIVQQMAARAEQTQKPVAWLSLGWNCNSLSLTILEETLSQQQAEQHAVAEMAVEEVQQQSISVTKLIRLAEISVQKAR